MNMHSSKSVIGRLTSDRLVASIAAICAVIGLAAIGCGGEDEGSTFPTDGLGGPSGDGTFGTGDGTGGTSGGSGGHLDVGGGSTALPSGCATDTYPGKSSRWICTSCSIGPAR